MRSRRGSGSFVWRGAALGTLAAVALLAAGCESTTTLVTSPDAGGIAVSGTGSVTVTPDIAQLNIGVEARAQTVAEVRRVAASAQEAVLASLRRNGVEERDIKTLGLNIRPEYGSRATPTPAVAPSVRPNGTAPSEAPGVAPTLGQPTIVAYVMTNTVSVKVRNLDNVSRIVDDAVAAGGDNVRLNGISFGVDKPERYAAEARELAVRDARERAEALARLTGVELGKPRSINESSGVPLALETRALAAPAAGGAPTPISPGESQVSMQVSIVYEVR